MENDRYLHCACKFVKKFKWFGSRKLHSSFNKGNNPHFPSNKSEKSIHNLYIVFNLLEQKFEGQLAYDMSIVKIFECWNIYFFFFIPVLFILEHDLNKKLLQSFIRIVYT